MHCARTALGAIAPDMGACDAEIIAQEVDEQPSGIDLSSTRLSVDSDSDVMTRHVFSISSAALHTHGCTVITERVARRTGANKAVRPAVQNLPKLPVTGTSRGAAKASTVRVMPVDTRTAHTVAHTVNRLVIDTDTAFDDVLERYESLVPTVDFAKLTRLVLSGDLSRVRQYTNELAPHTFVNFWTFDPSPQMQLFGHRTRAVTYMMGNNVIVERMFRHDPGVMLYAPLRTAIYEDTDGRTHFSIDQPSTRFASFGDPRIAAVGLELDTKLAEILQLMSLPVPVELEHDTA
jgi:Domain of unknown function DUF302